MQINTHTKKIIVRIFNQDQAIPNGAVLKTVPSFKYLFSIVTSTAKIDTDIIDKINEVSRVFGLLRDKVFNNNQLKLSTKFKVYEAVCIYTLLYGAETWTTYRRHVTQLEHFHISCFQKILGHSWMDRLTHTQILEHANIINIEDPIAKRQLHWLGHVIRMPEV